MVNPNSTTLHVNDKEVFLKYICEIEALIQKHFEDHNRWEWEYYSTGKRIAPSGEYLKNKSQLKEVFQSNNFKNTLSSWLDKESTFDKEKCWIEGYLHKANRFKIDNDNEVLSLINKIENIDDRDVREARKKIQKANTSNVIISKVRKAITELHRVGEVLSPILKKLFARRETLARKEGYEGYVDLALKSDGVKPKILEEAFNFVDLQTKVFWEKILKNHESSGLLSWELSSSMKKKQICKFICGDLSECKKLWNNIKKTFAPYLDNVYLKYNNHICFSPIISWPDEIFIGGFCDSSNVSEDCKWDIETAVTLMHEVGHVLYYKMLAECGGSFSDLYITPVALEEAVTFLAELLMFQGDFLKSISMVNSEIEPYYNDWRKMRIRFLRELLGFSRFDLEAYKLALESPDNMNDVWLSKLSEQTGVDYSDSHWAVVSYGFYTEDPMRRYAYILSALLAKKIAGDTWQGVINPSSYSPSGFLNIIQNLVTNWVDCPQVVLNDLSF